MFGKHRCQRDPVEEKLGNFSVELAMVEHGWRFWPADATEEQKRKAVEQYIETGQHHWYMPGEVEEPIVTEGKLIVPSSPVEENTCPWWRFW